MKPKPVVPRARAMRDVDEATSCNLAEGATQAALGLVDALEHAYEHLARLPASGSQRYALELNLPGLRFWPLPRYPYLVFYIERAGHVDVWRMLHAQQDIPDWMREEPNGP